MRLFSFLQAHDENCDGTLKKGRIVTGLRGYLKPGSVYVVILGCQFAILAMLIVPLASGLMLLAGILLLISIVLRSRITLEPWYLLIDCGLFCLAALVEPGLARFLFVYVYFYAWRGKLLYMVLPAGWSLFLLEGLYLILPIQALTIGLILQLWKVESKALYEEADVLRQRLYRMEQTELKLLSEHQDTARLSQLKERQRLAEQLHDNLGHELTAAHLSVKSIGTLLQQGDAGKAGRAQEKAEERLHAALHQLKKAVSRLEPDTETDMKTITGLFDNFMYPVQLERTGDPSDLKAYHIQLLHAAVKEALTNIAKHAVPHRVKAVLDTSGSIIKIVVENDGIKAASGERAGNGLRYMRKRLEAVHGSLSTSLDGMVFRIIIILPKDSR
jgi:signal transduction histidine kinase